MLGVKSGDYVHAVGGVPSISLAHFTDQCDEASGRAQGSWKYFVVTFTKATNGAHLDVHFIIGKPLGFHLKECYGPIVAVALEPSSAPSVAGVMPFARVVALDGDRLGRSLADGSFDDGSLERFTRACDSRMQDNVPFFVTFQDVTTEAARLEVEAKARADLSTGTGDQNNKDGSTQRLLPPLRPPTGWPLSERPPDLARVPPGWWQRWPAISNAPPGWKDPVAAEAQCAFYFRCVSLPAALPFLMFGNLLRELSWLCLILRSALPADEAVERFDRVFLALKSGIVEAAEAIPHIGLVLEPVITLAGGIFRTLFIYLDPFKVMDQLFELVPDAQIRCRGTQQPWFLLANLCLAAVIVMVVSAVMDSHDAFRFQRAWDVLTRGWEKKTSSHGGNKWVYRAPLMPTVATVGAERA